MGTEEKGRRCSGRRIVDNKKLDLTIVQKIKRVTWGPRDLKKEGVRGRKLE